MAGDMCKVNVAVLHLLVQFEGDPAVPPPGDDFFLLWYGGWGGAGAGGEPPTTPPPSPPKTARGAGSHPWGRGQGHGGRLEGDVVEDALLLKYSL